MGQQTVLELLLVIFMHLKLISLDFKINWHIFVCYSITSHLFNESRVVVFFYFLCISYMFSYSYICNKIPKKKDMGSFAVFAAVTPFFSD